MAARNSQQTNVFFHIHPSAVQDLIRLWENDADKAETENLRCYLGEVLLRVVAIVTTPEERRSHRDTLFLQDVAREIRKAITVTTEDGDRISFRFL